MIAVVNFSWPIFILCVSLGVSLLAVLVVGIIVGRLIESSSNASGHRIYSKNVERLGVLVRRARRLLTGSVDEEIVEAPSTLEEGSELSEPRTPADLTESVLQSVVQIVEVNERLHERLEISQGKLNQQDQELQSHMNAALTDQLTSLPNRRAFQNELDRRFAEWKRTQAVFCLVILDIDYFKLYNDRFGHPAGDKLLTEIAEVYRNALRDMDLVCRVGGEEFAIIMPSTKVHDAGMVANRLRMAVENYTFPGRRVTISVGLAPAMEGDSAATLYKRADKALYNSKSSGRNCVYYHDGKQCLFVPVEESQTKPEVRQPMSAEQDKSQVENLCNDLQHRLAEVTQRSL